MKIIATIIMIILWLVFLSHSHSVYRFGKEKLLNSAILWGKILMVIDTIGFFFIVIIIWFLK